MDYKYSLDIMRGQLENKYISPEIKYAFKASIEALEKQISFKNEVSQISGWFVDNKQSLLDSALIVSKKEFSESDIDNYIDGINLDFIVEDVVDDIHKGILNVLSTFSGNQVVDNWIPITNRLPTMEECQKNDCRFIATDGNRIYQLWFDYEDKYFEKCECNGLGLKTDNCVIAWQALPKPYKGE